MIRNYCDDDQLFVEIKQALNPSLAGSTIEELSWKSWLHGSALHTTGYLKVRGYDYREKLFYVFWIGHEFKVCAHFRFCKNIYPAWVMLLKREGAGCLEVYNCTYEVSAV